MKILVTGHKGFIGSRLFHDLRYEQGYGYGVEGLDSPDDIGDWVAPSGMFAEHYDCIIHLAAFAALRDSIENPEKFWENNVEKSNQYLIIVESIMSDYYMLVLLEHMVGGKILMQ